MPGSQSSLLPTSKDSLQVYQSVKLITERGRKPLGAAQIQHSTCCSHGLCNNLQHNGSQWSTGDQ
jgi:hypothetical protein